jgi:LacI family transcriptional regulator
LLSPDLADSINKLNVDYVISDHQYGGYLATKHLIELNHENIVFIGENDSYAGDLRYKGYKKALKEFKLPVHDVCLQDKILDVNELKELTSKFKQDRITGVFAAHDLIARDLLTNMQKIGIKVPDDFSLVGHDNLSFAEYLSVPLTTVKQPVEQEIATAAEILFNKIEHKTTAVKQMILPVELIIRKSTRVA